MSSELRTNLLRAIFDRIELTKEPYLATFCTISAKLGGNVLATCNIKFSLSLPLLAV